MGVLRFFSATRAAADLRQFLAYQRTQPHKAGFLGLSLATTAFFIFLIAHDSRATVAYHRHITYVEQYRFDRTDAEIKDQQKIDQAAKEKRQKEIDAALEKRRLEFKHVDDALKRYGL